MRDGRIVRGTLNQPLAFFRRWVGEKPLKPLADLALLSALNSKLVDGCKTYHGRHVSLSMIRRDLLRLVQNFDAQLEADIETCYRELSDRGRMPRPKI
jgi:hypothetical protein